MRALVLAALFATLSLAVPATSSADEIEDKLDAYRVKVRYPGSRPHWFAQLEGHASVISDAPERSVFATSRGYAVRAGYRFTRWGVFAMAEQNRWLSGEALGELTQGVMNLGIGMDLRYFNQRIRSSLTTGTSTLLFDTPFDDMWTTGYFWDLRPAGLRWFPADWLVIEFHPFTASTMVPVIRGPRLAQVVYRTVLALEVIP